MTERARDVLGWIDLILDDPNLRLLRYWTSLNAGYDLTLVDGWLFLRGAEVHGYFADKALPGEAGRAPLDRRPRDSARKRRERRRRVKASRRRNRS